MTVGANQVELFLKLRDRGIGLRSEGDQHDQLVVRGDSEALGPELLAELRERKRALLGVVRQLELGGVIWMMRHPLPRLPAQAIMDEGW